MMKKMKYIKSVLALILTLALMLSFSVFLNSCGNRVTITETEESTGGGATEESHSPKKTIYRLSSEKTNYVRIQIKNYGTIVIELYPEKAPETVKLFQELIKTKYYDNSEFDRLYKDSHMVGGTPVDKSMVDMLPPLAEENSALALSKGVVSLIRGEEKGARFFVCLDDSPEVSGTYVSFGKVIEGLDVLDKINKTNALNGVVLADKIQMLELRFVYPDLVGGRA